MTIHRKNNDAGTHVESQAGAGPARTALKLATKPRPLVNSGAIMLIVGTVLNLINQNEAFAGQIRFDYPRLALTYAVPFFVATYGAWSAHYARLKGA